MSLFDEYFTNDDKPFAENFNDALLLSNVFDFTVPISLPTMFNNSTWTDTTTPRKAGVSIVTLKETLPNTLSISTANNASVITGTGTLKLGIYPNFNSFGKFKSINWTSSNNKIQVNIKTTNNETVATNISKGTITSSNSHLRNLEEIVFEIVFTASDTLTSFELTMENTDSTNRYGADVKISAVDGLETRLTNIESKNTSQDTAINGKVDKVNNKGLSANDFTNTYKSKIDGLSTVATSGSYNDLSNKPSIPTKTSQLTNDGDGTNVFVKNNDSRLTNSRTPTSHTHGSITNTGAIGNASGKIITTGTNGVLQASDTITKSKISDFPATITPSSHTHGAVTNDGKIGNASGKIITTGESGALQASDTITKSKISDFPSTMTPSSHTHGSITNAGAIGNASGKIITTTTNGKLQASDSITKDKISDFSHTHGQVTNDGKVGSTANLPLITGTDGAITTSSFGTTANTFCQGNDSRLTNARTPTSHTHGSLANGGTLNSDTTTVNKVAVTDSSNNLKTISKVPFANLNIAKSDITGLGIPASDTNTTYTASTGLNLSGTAFSVKYGTASGTACAGNDSRLSNARTPTSHTHGNISNDGKIGDASGKLVVTGSGGALQTADTITKSKISDFPTTMTPSSHTHGNLDNNGKLGLANGIVVTNASKEIEAVSTITKSKISDFPSTMTPSSHTHGNITNGGAIGSTAGQIVITGESGVLQGADTITKSKISDFSHSHGSLANGGTLNSDITEVNKVAVTNSGNALKTIAKVPFANLNITKANITGLGIASNSVATTSANGLLSSSDKNFVNGLHNVVNYDVFPYPSTIYPTPTNNFMIDSYMTIACKVTDAVGNPIANKEVDLYVDGMTFREYIIQYDGFEMPYAWTPQTQLNEDTTGITDQNGMCTWKVWIGHWGNVDFRVGNGHCQINVFGWRLFAGGGGAWTFFADDKQAMLSLAGWRSNASTSWRQFGGSNYAEFYAPYSRVYYVTDELVWYVGTDGTIYFKSNTGSAIAEKNWTLQFSWQYQYDPYHDPTFRPELEL